MTKKKLYKEWSIRSTMNNKIQKKSSSKKKEENSIISSKWFNKIPKRYDLNNWPSSSNKHNGLLVWFHIDEIGSDQ